MTTNNKRKKGKCEEKKHAGKRHTRKKCKETKKVFLTHSVHVQHVHG